MEALEYDIHMTGEYVIVSKGPRSLWCSRKDGSLRPGSVVTPDNLASSHYLGKCWGLVGKIQFFAGAEWKLLLIGGARLVGVLPSCGQVHCIEKLVVIPLTTDPSPEIVGLEHQSSLTDSLTLQRDISPASGRRSSSTKTEGGGGGRQKEGKEKEKLERRLMEALLRMFNDSRSFYFSVEGDITHTQQRKLDHNSTSSSGDTDLLLWQTVDERFFWNKWMLEDLLNITCQRALVEPWIQPIIQGYVEIRTLVVHSNHPPDVLQTTRQDPRTSLGGKTGNGGWSDCDGGEREEVEMMTFEDEKNSCASQPLLIEVEGPEISTRSDASGYDSERDSSGNVPGDDEGEEEEEEERKGEGEGEGEGRGGGGKMEGGDVWSYNLMTESHSGSHSSDNVLRVDRDIRGCSEPHDMKVFSDESSATQTTETSEKRRNSRLLERLGLVRRSKSPGEYRETSDSGEVKKKAVLGGERTSGSEKQQLVVFGRESSTEGERGGTGVEGADGEEIESERKDKERNKQTEDVDRDDPTFTLALISRRSRHRAGTRYRRRGVDSLGNVANFVETEMVLQAGSHHVSYVLVRGSVPIFWTQPGSKYRPPPIIERDEEETQEAFRKHFEHQIKLYSNVAITNLINQSGRESILGEAFEHHVLALDSPHITYISFDFHRHLKADQNGAVKQLVTATHNLNKKFKFCWVDTNGTSGALCRQEGVFRVNCMDCLDRTNVIQTAFCREVLQSALQKLGIIPFDEHLSGAMLTTYKIMWANNGDFISRQYTGTAAMKGDLTRYGERKFSGMMKDGYNSAHRYYQNMFRDSYRQVLIDLMQGRPHSEAFSSLPPSLRGRRDGGEGKGEDEEGEEEEEEEELWSLNREQAIAEMIQLCREELFPTQTHHVLGWALVEAAGYSFVESSLKEEDCVLMQCREKNQLCVASYNVEDDQVTCFIRIPMEKVEKIVIGPLGTILRSSKRLHLRLYYTLMDTRQCYFTFKTVNFTSMEEDREILLSIATTLSNICQTIVVHEQKLTKKKSPLHQGVIHLVMPNEWEGIGEDSLSPRPHGSTQPRQPLAGDSDEDCGLDEEDEKEQSFSVPASPTLTRRPLPLQGHAHGRTRRICSQSFDDIVSSVNNEQGLPLSPSSISKNPVPLITGQNPAFELPCPLDSESDDEVISTTEHGLGVAYNHTLLVSSQPELRGSSTVPQGAGKFNRLKGKFFRKVKQAQGQRTESSRSLQVPQQTQCVSDRPTSGSGSDVPPQDTAPEEANSHQLSLMTHRLLAVRQRFRNSPALLRRMGVGGRGHSAAHPAPPTSGSETAGVVDDGGECRRAAREKSQSMFIAL